MFLVLFCLTAVTVASPKFDPGWSRLPAGTEIPELRTTTSRTFSNGDGTFTAEIHVAQGGGRHRAKPAKTEQAVADSSFYPHVEQYWTGSAARSLQGGGYAKGDEYIGYGSNMNDDWFGWAKYDLTPIPDSADIVSTAVHYYVNEVYVTGRSHILLLNTDPVTASAEMLFNSRGSDCCELQRDSVVGWRSRTLTETGRTAVAQSLGRDWISLAHAPWQYASAVISGYGSGAERPHLLVRYIGPRSTDLCAITSRLTTYPLGVGTSDTAEAVFTNAGNAVANGFRLYAIDHGTICDSTTVASLSPGETTAVRLRVTTPSAGDYLAVYEFAANDSGDASHANDTTSLRCWAFPTATYSAEGFDDSVFPPPGWAAFDNDSGSQFWQRVPHEPMAHSGPGFALCAQEQLRANDDWLIGGPIYPDSDGRDSVGYFARAYQDTPQQSLGVWTLHGQSPDDSIERISSVGVSDTVYRRRALSLDRYDGDTIYLGFQNASSGDWNGVCLDDIWFSRVSVPGTSEPSASVPTRPTLTIEPNPMSGRHATVRYNISAGTRASLTLRDVLGRTVRTVELDATGTTRLDLRGVAPGVYVATLESVSPSVSRKLVITAPR